MTKIPQTGDAMKSEIMIYGRNKQPQKGTFPNSTTLVDQMSEYRRVLAGPCILIKDQWFNADTGQKDMAEYIKNWKRRSIKNRKLRDHRKHKREIANLEIKIASLPPHVQSLRFGRTAEVTKIGNHWSKVDYRATYGLPLGEPGPLPDFRSMRLLFSTVLKRINTFTKPYFAEIGTHSPITSERTSLRRLAQERQKILLRSTVAKQPTAIDIRLLWRFRHALTDGYVRLGALLLNLECFVDNSLIFDPTCPNPRIKGRRGGIRAWIARFCPELSGHYKTLMRYRALAQRLRQAIELPDPLPLSFLLSGQPDKCPDTHIVNIQPSRHDGFAEVQRFPWELQPTQMDWEGHLFKSNTLYTHRRPFDLSPENVRRTLALSRKLLADILSLVMATTNNPHTKRHLSAELTKRIVKAVEVREHWWRTH